MSSVACSAGFASCKTFDKQPKHPCFGAKPPYRSSAICATASCSGFVWLTTSILAWTRGGSPSNIAPFPGKGAWGFGKDAEIERPKALQDAKPTKRSYRDREFALFYKKTDFFYKLSVTNNRSAKPDGTGISALFECLRLSEQTIFKNDLTSATD